MKKKIIIIFIQGKYYKIAKNCITNFHALFAIKPIHPVIQFV